MLQFETEIRIAAIPCQVVPPSRERPAERRPQVGKVHGLRDWAVRQALEEAARQLGGPAEQRVAIIHGVDRHCG